MDFNSFLRVVLDLSTPGVVCDAKSVQRVKSNNLISWDLMLEFSFKKDRFEFHKELFFFV